MTVRFNTRPDGRLETVETIHAVEERELQLRTVIARDRGTLRRMLAGNEPFHVDSMAAPAMVVGVDLGAPEGDATVITMRYRAGETVTHTGGPCTLQNLPKPAAEVWHTEAPTVRGVYIADLASCVEADPSNAARWHRYWDGKSFSIAWLPTTPEDQRDRMRASPSAASIQWLRLVEADAPAPEYIVCVKGSKWLKVGQIAHQAGGGGFDPDNWRPCDAEGWIAHVPTADAVCPVPEGVAFDGKWYDGDVMRNVPNRFAYLWQMRDDSDASFVAWRPVVQ